MTMARREPRCFVRLLFQISGILCLFLQVIRPMLSTDEVEVCASVPESVRDLYTDMVSYRMKTSEMAVGLVVHRPAAAATGEVLWCGGTRRRPFSDGTERSRWTIPALLARVGESPEQTAQRLWQALLPVATLATRPFRLASSLVTATRKNFTSVEGGMINAVFPVGLISQSPWYGAEGRDASVVFYATADAATVGALQLAAAFRPADDRETGFSECAFASTEADLPPSSSPIDPTDLGVADAVLRAWYRQGTAAPTPLK